MKEKLIISIFSNTCSHLIYIFSLYLLFYNLEESLIGIWMLLNGVINLGFLFINIGLDVIHYQYSGKSNFEDYFGTFFYIKIVNLLINIFITIVITFFISNLFLWNIQYLIYITFILLSNILNNISRIFLVNLIAKIKVFKAEIPKFLFTIGQCISILILSFNLDLFPDPLLYLSITFLILEIIKMIIILILSENEFTFSKFKRAIILEYLYSIRPLFLQSIIIIISNNLGDLILAYFFSYEILAYFSLIKNFIIPGLMTVSGSIFTIYLSLLAKYFEKNKISEIKKITYIIEKYSSILYLSILIIVLLNGELIISLFLPHYIESLPILHIMIFIPYLISITQPYFYQFIAGKKQHVPVGINILTHSLIIFLMIFLIPKNFFFQNFGYGAIGYALAQTLPLILWVFLNRYYSSKIFNIKANKKILLHFPLGMISFFISLYFKDFLTHLFFINPFAVLVISSLFSFFVFLTGLCLFKEIKKEDLKFLKQLIQFKDYKESFKNEFKQLPIF